MPACQVRGAAASDLMRVTLDRSVDWTSLAADWRALEQRAPASFFQSWSWLGPLAAERFDRPLLLRVEVDGRTTGLALCNRHRGRLLLSESGRAEPDNLFIEHNAPLLEAGNHAVAARVLDTLAGARLGPLRLSGIDAATLAALAPTRHRLRAVRPAPWIDLASLAGPEAWLAELSANSRAQLRRSDRAFAAAGPIVATPAPDLPTARDWFSSLVALHQRSRGARGQPGAFASQFVRRFHQCLIETAFPRGEIDLLRIAAGPRELGFLYNFHHRGRVLCYQSGFDYAAARGAEKPGLSSHHAAIRLAFARGDGAYDFLAGHERYKLSLATRSTELFWVEAGSLLARAAGRVIERLDR